VLLIAPTLQAEEQTRAPGKRPLRVVRHVVTTGVVNREPIDAATVFSPSVGTLYYFTEVQGAAAPTQILHVWYYQDQKLIAIPLPVDAAHWRTWSRKEILGIWTGPWKVEAVTPDGRVLSSQTFAIH
jgi:hypothetical protein